MKQTRVMSVSLNSGKICINTTIFKLQQPSCLQDSEPRLEKHLQWSNDMHTTNRCFKERSREHRISKVKPQCKHCSCCSSLKDTSWDGATLNSEEIKPVASAIIKFCLSEGISLYISSQSLKFLATWWIGIGLIWSYLLNFLAGFGMICRGKRPLTSSISYVQYC